MRHGEAGSAMRDFDRPLTDEGIVQCKARALILQQHGVVCSAIVSSPAVRARSSAAAVAGVMSYSEDKIVVADALYNASEDIILEVIRHFDDTWHTVLLLGHNPGLSFLASTLCPQIQGNLDVGELYAISFPLLHWSDITASKGQLITYN
ncbi:MAG: phosphohistidine phosphatase [Gammaproteobacteria bacterium]|nr:phosphohistidine phosphatase [Gammaproteobacteria bacterium]